MRNCFLVTLEARRNKEKSNNKQQKNRREKTRPSNKSTWPDNYECRLIPRLEKKKKETSLSHPGCYFDFSWSCLSVHWLTRNGYVCTPTSPRQDCYTLCTMSTLLFSKPTRVCVWAQLWPYYVLYWVSDLDQSVAICAWIHDSSSLSLSLSRSLPRSGVLRIEI